ncbi:hypothetical protein GUITHDRAFT_143034 [Guillardia theta CCMP2712]|uniref:AMP-dependent synthetase/ligase domain-containing protein n=1 Tax=Guillardia theta (strain CCMP2712) TaxID=905079 RepID=L1IW63_GUITC|nr:hypothetical protein GUITHDRAFT_143034 [Guillardia theta CCMP2712]EKX40085.1 hypothetical protein GUITHDRAFT_143034 [Guillardia theta CCMP2712]|eukprot:XP_005827065.1 hypothetical protein GUITHDRAFT_143034 [Guillardia theta CCMP2712]
MSLKGVATPSWGEREAENESKVHRAPGYEKELVSLPFSDEPHINTMSACLKRARDKFASRPFLGERTREPEGKRGKYVFETYEKCYTDILRLGVGLVQQCGLDSTGKEGESQFRIGIYSINRSEWTKLLHAAWRSRIVVVPLYDTLMLNSVTYIVTHAELTTIAAERAKLPNLIKCDWKGSNLRNISTLMPAPKDWACIMYTSGTTGVPKGVIQTHENVLSSAAGILRQNFREDLLLEDNLYISYLPLAHSLEVGLQNCVVLVGCAIGFYQGDVKKLVSEDLPDLRPTIMAGVPRIYARIYDKVLMGVESKGFIAKTIFNWGMRSKKTKFIYNKILFNKLKRVLGGRIRLLASGAAPLSAELHNFLRQVFDCPVLEGYGMTENSATACVQPLGSIKGGNVGGPTPVVEVKLRDTEDYKSSDVYPTTKREFEQQASFKGPFDPTLAGRVVERGEICLRGFNVFPGYLKNEEESREALDDKGWLHTGDIGMWNQDGSLSVIDRKKNIFKLAQGEYVAPEAVENALSACKWVGQCWIYGNSYENYVVAVIVPDREVLMTWAGRHRPRTSMADLVRDPAVKRMIFDDVIAIGRAAKLRGFELPCEIEFETEVNEAGQGFTIEEELVTPTLKLRRSNLVKKYQARIDAMYQQIRKNDKIAKKI